MLPAMHLDQLRHQAEALLPEALDWLQRMVAINSFTSNAPGVDELGELTATCFAPLGFTTQFVDSAEPSYGRHLFLRRRPRLAPASPPVVLVTHLDTVFPPEEETRNDFRWLEEGDRIYGPGTVDNKGGTVLIWMMLRMLRHSMPDLFDQTHWVIAANSAEEVIGADFANRTREICEGQARAVLVFEGGPRQESDYHVVTSRKGRMEYRITCTGRGAHAGSSHAEGINAVVELSRLLPKVAALSNPAHELTVNVANVHGGTVLNRVPHQAVAELEMRAFEPAVLAEAANALEAFAGMTEGGAHMSVECMGRTHAWPGGGETARLVHFWQEAAARLGLRAVPMRRGGLSDANYLCDLGPTLDAMGPAGGNAHCSERTPDGSKMPEFVERSSFIPKAVMNVLALEKWLAGA